jgi:choline-sulfatase
MSQPRNIVVLMTDDHGAWAAGCYGNRELKTPHLDALARDGARATHAYTPNPVCSPARACFFTGTFPSQHGIHDWLQENPAEPHAWLDGQTTLPQRLQAAGYRTGLVGKWHCGNSHQPQPGFDFWLGYADGQYPHVGEQNLICNGKPETFHGHQSPYLTSRALDFLNASDQRPFFLFLGLVDTHSPFATHPEERVAPYRDCTFEDLPREPYTGPGWIRLGDPPDETRRREWAAQYYAAVGTIDEQVGRVVAALEANGQLDNTLIVYTSDHGHMNGHHGLYTKGNATVPQNFYDESIRVPLLLRHPGSISAGLELTSPVDHCDLHDTLCDYAGIGGSETGPGRSFRVLLDSKTDAAWRSSQICEYGNARMVRTDRWKYIQRFAPHEATYGDALYDLANDPRETTNVIGDPAQADVVSKLREALTTFFDRSEVPEKSGHHILNQRQTNSGEPWRLAPPDSPDPAGTDWVVLDRF